MQLQNARQLSVFPSRIHALLASAEDVGVIFRRGPSKQVATFLWDRRTDHFSLGQWLKGRIYERRADISPDGKHMIYFAMNGKWRSETRGSWTAVSKTPYLKALDLYGKGDCWDGGGLFLSSDRYWINDRYFNPDNRLTKQSSLQADSKFRPDFHYGSECTGVYYPKLIRDGWALKEISERGKWDSQTIFEKSLPGGWTLRKIAHEMVDAPVGKGCYWDEHELENQISNTLMKFPNWEWADWDSHTIVWAEQGKMYRAGFSDDTSLKKPIVLHDFNPYKFENIIAPY